jgi:hypothetical protein
MNRILNSKIIFTGYGLWGALGVYRGVKDYNKEFHIKNKKYLSNPTYVTKPEYYYLTCFFRSMIYLSYYIIPPFTLFSLIGELYNIEMTIRGIEEEKD